MFFKTTFTFKTRRRTKILAFLLIIVELAIVANSSLPCPKNCNCYQSERGVSALCTNLIWNSTTYLNVHELVIRPARPSNECYISENAHKVFPNLLMLNLSNCSLNFILNERFKNFESVDTIDLSNNYLRDFSPSVFSSNRRLRFVNLQNNPLNVTSTTLFESNSLYELNLDSCNITKISLNMFKGLPELKYLTLSNNKISYLEDNSLPNKLKILNLANNNISNVPTSELLRLSLLTEINLSGNPINCTCQLMGYQNWVSGKGLIFLNVIKCAYPPKYAGQSLNNIPQYEMCDSKVQNEPVSAEQCSPNQICSNFIIPIEDGFLSDQPISRQDDSDIFQNDEVIPLQNRNSSIIDENEGSGNYEPDEGTEIPSTNSEVIAHSITAVINQTSSTTSAGVEKYNNELVTPSVFVIVSENSSEVIPSVSSNISENSSDPMNTVISFSTEKQNTTSFWANDTDSTVILNLPEKNNPTISPSLDNSQLQAKWKNDSYSVKKTEAFNYVIPILAILLIILICLTVYCSQHATTKKNWKEENRNSEGSELQEVSLLPDKSLPTIMKHSDKYPDEKENGQNEWLMNESQELTNGNLQKVNENGNLHSSETINCNKLPNEQSTVQNVPERIERTLVKVTTLPDSVPKTPIIRNV